MIQNAIKIFRDSDYWAVSEKDTLCFKSTRFEICYQYASYLARKNQTLLEVNVQSKIFKTHFSDAEMSVGA